MLTIGNEAAIWYNRGQQACPEALGAIHKAYAVVGENQEECRTELGQALWNGGNTLGFWAY